MLCMLMYHTGYWLFGRGDNTWLWLKEMHTKAWELSVVIFNWKGQFLMIWSQFSKTCGNLTFVSITMHMLNTYYMYAYFLSAAHSYITLTNTYTLAIYFTIWYCRKRVAERRRNFCFLSYQIIGKSWESSHMADIIPFIVTLHTCYILANLNLIFFEYFHLPYSTWYVRMQALSASEY